MKNVIITSFIFIFSLFFIQDVSALENQQLGTIVADSGGFLSLSSFPSWSSMGYNTYSDGSWASASPTSNFVYGTNGGALTQCGIPVVQDMYYSVTYTFQWTSNFDYLHPYYTTWTGHEIGICDNSNCSPDLPYETVSSGVEYTNYNGTILGFFTVIFQSPKNGTCVNIAFSSNSHTLNSQNVNFVGYRYESLGSKSLSESDIQEALEVNFNNIQNSINQFQQEQQETNDKLDDITNMDIPDSSKEDLDDSSYQDYQGAEDDLMDSVGEADLSSVDIAIDGDSSNFIWDTITDIFQSYPLIMSTVIAILSIGIIKLALGR